MLRAEGIRKTYKGGKEDLHVLKGIDFEVKRGESVALLGPSGAGKSTLLHILGGLDRPTSGKIFLDGQDLYNLPDRKKAILRNQKIGFVFQFYHLLSEFSTLENTMMPGLINYDSRITIRESRNKAQGLLQKLGLGDRLLHRPNELSGGEQQRAAIARALMNNPEVLLCDEPTGNLDSKMGKEILDILFSLNKESQTTIVIVTHDHEIAKRAEKVLEIKDGKILYTVVKGPTLRIKEERWG